MDYTVRSLTQTGANKMMIEDLADFEVYEAKELLNDMEK